MTNLVKYPIFAVLCRKSQSIIFSRQIINFFCYSENTYHLYLLSVWSCGYQKNMLTGSDTASQSSLDTTEYPDDDVFRVLIATDIHLGYNEKDPVRGDDSFRSFEEILKTAAELEVDFLLLGGDLFHDTKPSPYCIFKCTELLRKYCLGNKPIEVEFLSDQAVAFKGNVSQNVNYEDPNLNISIPVFSIHGNHDDPTGPKLISAMDLISSTGLVNYFGRVTDLKKIEVEPILLRKGETQIALYGMSHVKDERLGRMFLDGKVSMMSPPDKEEWFHLLVWHQNRATRGVKNFIPDETLPDFLDLVVWGHEHDCRIIPEGTSTGVFITQPGSSVATSLAQGESIPKKIGLLRVFKKKFNLQPITLKTVRPFIFKECILDDIDTTDISADHQEKAMKVLEAKIEEMIEEAKQTECNVPSVRDLPLIRLKVFYKDEIQSFNAIRFGQRYVGRVANPEDIVRLAPFRKTRGPQMRMSFDTDRTFDHVEEWATRVEDIVLKHFDEDQKLKMIPVKGITESVIKFIDSNDTDAPADYLNFQCDQLMHKLLEDEPDIRDVAEYIENYVSQKERENKDIEEATNLLNDQNRGKNRRKKSDKSDESTTISDDDDDEEDIPLTSYSSKTATTPAKGPGSRGGRGSRGSRGSRAGKGSRGGRGKAKDS